MPEKKPRTVVLKTLPGFQPGHIRVGGRQKRTAAQARSLADELGVDPLAYLLNLLAVDATEEVEFTADGTEHRVKVPVSRELKVPISQSVVGLFYPKLNSTAVSGPEGGPIETVNLDAVLFTPELSEAASRLSLLLDAARAIDAASTTARLCGSPGESGAHPAVSDSEQS